MRCGNRRKFGAERSKTKLSKNRQSMTSVYWRVGLKGLRIFITISKNKNDNDYDYKATAFFATLLVGGTRPAHKTQHPPALQFFRLNFEK